ncbi:MAG: hypothetical protein EP318_06205 [Rhodobacteraceae bacterium]|nr:MAG: hypothetical protein EP318_06205 [Paracoccaceae bacterium]
MSALDMSYGAKVLVGDDNWRYGPKLPALAAFLFGRRERFEHLGMRCTVAWYKGQPYLIHMREAG